jgi:hypothetical protein
MSHESNSKPLYLGSLKSALVGDDGAGGICDLRKRNVQSPCHRDYSAKINCVLHDQQETTSSISKLLISLASEKNQEFIRHAAG